MKAPKHLWSAALAPFSLGLVMLLFSGFAKDAVQVDSLLAPWIGVWTITGDRTGDRANDLNLKAAVEIRPTTDGKGLEISRKIPGQPDVKEVLIPDGTKRPVEAQNCSGWQMAKWIPEAGLIAGSSEMDCRQSGSYATTNLKMILATDQMVDILAISAAGQTRVAVRRLAFDRDLAPSAISQSSLAAAAARMALGAPWSTNTIIHLSGTIDAPVLEAALVERNARVELAPKSLRQMKAAGVPKEVIDLLVALAFPDQFDIKQNGQVALRPLPGASTAGYSPGFYPQGTGYYPGAFYNCYFPYDFAFPGYVGLYAPGSCWGYYSPFWWGYPLSFFILNSSQNNARVSASSGYVQIVHRDTGHHARPRQGFYPGKSSQGSSSAHNSSAGGSSGSSAGGSSGSSTGSSAGAGVSPGGYSSGGGGGERAVPR